MIELEKLYQIFLTYNEIVTDSRKVKKDVLFFALQGTHFDGNTFTADAIKNGAAYAITDDPENASGDQYILVDNVLQTLQQLATYHRRKLGIPIIAITGTNGKTTTKELLKNILIEKFNTYATKGNLNNHIGVPLTLLEMNKTTEWAIVEMGANHPGEIKQLCEITEPTHGIITNIGKAHLEGFGSFEGVVKTKSELYDYLSTNNGTVFYNGDNPILYSKLSEYNNIRKLAYGLSDHFYCNGVLHSYNPFLSVELIEKNHKEIIKTRLIGKYNFENVMAAACVGKYAGYDLKTISKAISDYIPQNNRSQLMEINSNKIIMDFYNANPTSMTAAIENFSDLDSSQLKKKLILGDMFELGNYAEIEHKALIDKIDTLKFTEVYLIGPIFKSVNNNSTYLTFENTEEFKKYLMSHPIKDSFILLKGSRGVKLENICDQL